MDSGLTYSSQGHQDVLSGANVLVVRAVSVQVGSAVHQPRGVEHDGVTQQSGDEQAVSKGLAPAIAGHKGGQDEAHQQNAGFVVPTVRDQMLG